jgi:hypothetical protein
LARDLTTHLPENAIRNRVFDRDGNFIYTSNAAVERDQAAGRITGLSNLNKFGQTGADIDTADGLVDVWSGVANASADKNYTYSTSADIDTISSSSAADTQDVVITGLDENWLEVVQTKTLTGQTKAVLDTPLIRVYRMYNAGTTDFAGNVFCYVDGAISGGIPTTSSSIRAIIENGYNQTLMCLYTVPANKYLYLYKGEAALVSKLAGYADGTFEVRPFGGVFLTKRTFGLSTTGSSYINVLFPQPLFVPPKADLRVRVSSSANNMDAIASFIGVLEDI